MRFRRFVFISCVNLLWSISALANYAEGQQAAASGDTEAAIKHYLAEAANSESPLAEASLWEAARLQLDKQKFADFKVTASQFQDRYPNTEKAYWLEFWATCVPIYEGKPHEAYSQLKSLSEHPKLPELATPIRDALGTADEARYLAAQQAYSTQNYAAVSDLARGYLADHPEGDKALWLEFWIAASPAMQGEAISTAELDAILATSNLAPDLRAQVEQIKAQAEAKIEESRALAETSAWETAQALLASKSYDAFTTASMEFIRQFPGTERAEWMMFWNACVPLWQGKPAESIPKLSTLIVNSPGDKVREPALLELAKCQQATADIEGIGKTAQQYRSRYPSGPNLSSIDYFDAMTYVSAQFPNQAADKLLNYLATWPDSELKPDVQLAYIQALHDANRYQEIDAAVDNYLEQFPDSPAIVDVKYIKMLVPFVGPEPNWNEAINRCQAFKTEYPGSEYAPHADLNRGWALFEKSNSLAKENNNQDMVRFLRERSHDAMEEFRKCLLTLSENDPRRTKREIELLDSYYHEGDLESAGREAARQEAKYSNDPSRCAIARLYMGIVNINKESPNAEQALEDFLAVLLCPLKPGTYDDVIGTHAAIWGLSTALSKDQLEYAQTAYAFIKYKIPKSELQQMAVRSFATLDTDLKIWEKY